MPYCFVPKCNGGSKAQRDFFKDNNRPKLHFFQAPSEEARIEWEKLIKRKDKPLSLTDKVCSSHFLEKDIIAHDKHVVNGKDVFIPRERALLNKGALPLQLQNYPPYYQPKINKRTGPPKRHNFEPKKKFKKVMDTEKSTLSNSPDGGSDVNDKDQQEQVEIPTEISDQTPPVPEAPTQLVGWIQTAKSMSLPTDWIICNTLTNNQIVVAHINPNTIQIDKKITFEDKCAPDIVFRGTVNYKGNHTSIIENLQDAQKIVNCIDLMKVCEGTGIIEKPYSVACNGPAVPKGKRCTYCHQELWRQVKIKDRKENAKKKLEQKRFKNKQQKQALKRAKERLKKKVQECKKIIQKKILECSEKNEKVLAEAIQKLPPVQQEAVTACFEASRKKSPCGRRYTLQWVYECMLIKIKSPSLYQHILDHNILPMPSITTIKAYLKKYRGAYGFQKSTFHLLEKKAEELPANKRRGVLLFDEMKLPPGVYFEESALKVEGFVNFGEGLAEFGQDLEEQYEAASQKLPCNPKQKQKDARKAKRNAKTEKKRDKNLGDHGLVVAFQPFQGTWIQTLACFLSKGAADDEQLTKLVLEATILMENSNYSVDGIVTDGASWNRSMWDRFGVSEEQVSVEHPCQPNRRLFFISDFPHLLKCMRNCMVTKKEIETPEGMIKLSHWNAVVEADSLREIGLRECPRLTKDHLNPNPWEKMRCGLAWQFWSHSAAAGMESFRFQGVEQLEDCDASVKICKLVNDLADIMNSRLPVNALKPNSPQVEKIKEFLSWLARTQDHLTQKMRLAELKAEDVRIKFLEEHNKKNQKKKRITPRHKEILKRKDYVFSESTDYGLKISLNATLQLLEYLTSEEIGYQFLMTSRQNQDALERFFGLMRQSCGPNTHPEPRVFVQLFKLLSVYSLVKPIKGSNITGGEMLHSLFTMEDLKSQTNIERRKELDRRLDDLVQAGANLDEIPDLVAIFEDHNYIEESMDEFALVYVAGYTARKALKFSNKCSACEKSLILANPSDATDEHLLIKLKSRGYLTFPSNEVVKLLRHLEKIFVKTSKNNQLEENILFVVVEELEKYQGAGLTSVGCDQHSPTLTKDIIKFYLIMRLHFLCKAWNAKTKEQNKKHRKLRKEAHMV